ncbi:hypothetical protein PSAC2689_250014 [Paraburkholderia sacchari]
MALGPTFTAGMAFESAFAHSVYCAHDVDAFAPLFVLAFECRGALMAKNAAETVRKVWICRLFMRYSYFETAFHCAMARSRPEFLGRVAVCTNEGVERIFKGSLLRCNFYMPLPRAQL